MNALQRLAAIAAIVPMFWWYVMPNAVDFFAHQGTFRCSTGESHCAAGDAAALQMMDHVRSNPRPK